MNIHEDRLADIRGIVARAIGLTAADMADEVDLLTTYVASLRDIGVAISAIEEKYGVRIAMDEAGDRPTILSIYRATARRARWPD